MRATGCGKRGGGVERAWLAGLLWPEATEAAALKNLRSSLADLRQALGPAAGRLFAAAESLREGGGWALAPVYRTEYEQQMAAVRGALGDQEFAAAEGRALSLEEAVRYALEEVDDG